SWSPSKGRAGCKRRATERADAGRTRKSVGICGFNPRICTIVAPYRVDSTKARWAGMPDFPVSRWESRLFRAFAVREDDRCDGRARSSAPRVVLRFEGLKNRFRTFTPETEFPTPQNGFEKFNPGSGGSRVPDGAPRAGDEMRGHDGAADIHRSQTRSQ